jgi:hypothetical protein
MIRGFSPACERNKEPISEVMKEYINEGNLLEIGSGTAQHAEFIAPLFPKIKWYLSEHKSNYKNICTFYSELNHRNIQAPVKLTIGEDDFPKVSFQYVFTANTLHIMSWKEVKTLIKLCGKRLREGSLLFIYGPFKYNGEYTSDSNYNFDISLKDRDPQSGLREFEKVKEGLESVGLKLLKDYQMPANNQLLVFERKAFN